MSVDYQGLFDASVGKYKTLGEAIKGFQTDFCLGAACELCGNALKEGTGAGTCRRCNVVCYCSKECQTTDWNNGGHKEECKAIQAATPIASLCSDFSKTEDKSSVAGRHFTRFVDVAARELHAEQIGRGGWGGGGPRGGGGGFRGGGGGGRRWGGSGWGNWGRAVLSTALFGPPVYGLWRGRRLPWYARGGYYYPWWYGIAPSYYEQRIPYGTYGVPPYPPQSWGYVTPPPQGMPGYQAVPDPVPV